MTRTRRRPMSASDTVIVAAPALAVWTQVADPSQMGRWSPENRGARTPEPGRPLVVGERFVGANARGRARWHTSCVVTVADPGARFAFRVERIGVGVPRLRGAIATWDYTFETVEDGSTRVTETWHDDRVGWPDRVAAIVDPVLTGGRSFADFQQRNIARTLGALRDDLAE